VDVNVEQVVRRPSRLRALAALEANAESSAEALDRITRLACRSLDVPVALINLVDADRQHIMGCASMPEPWSSLGELPLTHGFCPFALGADEAFTIADTREEPEICDNPAVRELGVRAYAGVPLRAAGGEPVGTLCAVDLDPHPWSRDELAVMGDLAASATAELQLLAATRRAARHNTCLRALAELTTSIATAHTPRELSDQIARAVAPLGAGAVWLLTADGPAPDATLRASAGRHRDVALDSDLAPAQVARTGEPAFLATSGEVHERCAIEADAAVCAAAVLPVAGEQAPTGVLGVCFGQEREFSGDDREFLCAVAGVTGLALATA
jgi:GAF domain-containing protein